MQITIYIPDVNYLELELQKAECGCQDETLEKFASKLLCLGACVADKRRMLVRNPEALQEFLDSL